ncbi:hypothetical protein [Avibacterium paragallinarum]|uniref:Uncharacterized protein n=1 Tax=Avibacterium paragallinarum TaxID=728 RepID=A0A377I7M4_AVIPA|nr:hypothetical protein [Avibacterium paragallinarum]RZN74503.1 hypothetical protein EC523_12195 [Avibacterium paragallinarum]RZN75267.1 hypothetical protein EC523_09210 [Avibacterium paragallinarum]RZN76398.1 hypothetical protein EC523_05260 [Avibacterium paragallinarum]CDF98936.1 Hypothetical protein AJF4211_000310 [Avibacterium paragallinarum JF4211]CDF99200.1 Hypothetical protein AJF4211_000050 [Avibacterium paragallinarum JF4211]
MKQRNLQRKKSLKVANVLKALERENAEQLNQAKENEEVVAQLEKQALSSVARKWELTEQFLADTTLPHSLQVALKDYQAALSIAISQKVKVNRRLLGGF